MTEPQTPDFYEYPWTPLCEASLTATGVLVRWADGVEFECNRWWLRENSVMDSIDQRPGIDPVTRETTLDLAQMPVDLLASDAQVVDGALAVRFQPEDIDVVFHPGWLRHVADGLHGPFDVLPEVEVWTTADLTSPPTRDASGSIDDHTLAGWLHDLVRFGIARLEGVGDDPNLTEETVSRIGALRGSNFGLVWHVDVDLDPVSTANTPMRLPAHTDLPTRETPPGFQFLHCLVNEAAGGESTMTDGLAVAAAMRRDEPHLFDALTQLEWVFFNRSKDDDHRWVGPFIDRGDGRVPHTFRGFHPVRAFPAMEPDQVELAYQALRRFGQLANDPSFQMRYPFRSGDLVAFDNRRIFHGREAFQPAPGRPGRRLHGTYMDSDEVYSRLRVLTRRGIRPDPCRFNPSLTASTVPNP